MIIYIFTAQLRNIRSVHPTSNTSAPEPQMMLCTLYIELHSLRKCVQLSKWELIDQGQFFRARQVSSVSEVNTLNFQLRRKLSGQIVWMRAYSIV